MDNNWKSKVSSLVSSEYKAEVLPYSYIDFGREKNEECISIIIQERKNFFDKIFPFLKEISSFDKAQKTAFSLINSLKTKMPENYYCFIGTTRWLGDYKPSGVELVFCQGNTQFDILRQAHSDACNYDLDTEALINKLQEYDKKCGIEIFHAETDTIEFKLNSMPENLQDFAEDIYEFCPDIVDQGCGSIENLKQEILKTKRVYLWWD